MAWTIVCYLDLVFSLVSKLLIQGFYRIFSSFRDLVPVSAVLGLPNDGYIASFFQLDPFHRTVGLRLNHVEPCLIFALGFLLVKYHVIFIGCIISPTRCKKQRCAKHASE